MALVTVVSTGCKDLSCAPQWISGRCGGICHCEGPVWSDGRDGVNLHAANGDAPRLNF